MTTWVSGFSVQPCNDRGVQVKIHPTAFIPMEEEGAMIRMNATGALYLVQRIVESLPRDAYVGRERGAVEEVVRALTQLRDGTNSISGEDIYEAAQRVMPPQAFANLMSTSLDKAARTFAAFEASRSQAGERVPPFPVVGACATLGPTSPPFRYHSYEGERHTGRHEASVCRYYGDGVTDDGAHECYAHVFAISEREVCRRAQWVADALNNAREPTTPLVVIERDLLKEALLRANDLCHALDLDDGTHEHHKVKEAAHFHDVAMDNLRRLDGKQKQTDDEAAAARAAQKPTALDLSVWDGVAGSVSRGPWPTLEQDDAMFLFGGPAMMRRLIALVRAKEAPVPLEELVAKPEAPRAPPLVIGEEVRAMIERRVVVEAGRNSGGWHEDTLSLVCPLDPPVKIHIATETSLVARAELVRSFLRALVHEALTLERSRAFESQGDPR